ncbi:dipeptide/oligopeptide/nickel ABC transporter ATP-binding protein [Kaistia sp. 32K]|uniref:dipeptide/oligopeptide/nickel ABC transporter permease/ATP-binding protein n=1 Tax=Kaistia sp. 32K TaxID=2795690 RepID=UPI0019152CEB|nr:dipeptide/oligopeptide/nickel ABC transporter permease/ATP-binding protein [Kaistia sp. 32K]BCP52363.1 dipeptide/oligopeptide/nickel ABC transporter ATP-binding protein [Kaistia sp. 32K]
MSTTDLQASAPSLPSVARGRAVLRRFLSNPLALIASTLFLLIVLTAVLAHWIAPFGPNYTRLALVTAPPGGEFWLGGDGAGRDVLSRLIYASRLTLSGSFLTVIVAATLGVSTGLIAGYFGGWFERVGDWLANFLIVLPGTIVLVAMFTLIGPNIFITMVVLGILIAPNFFRLVRNLVLSVRSELYVDAARVSGLSDARIIRRHILPVVRAPIIIMAASVWGIAIVVQAGLEFIGLGDPSTPTWGSMLLDAYNNIYIGRHLLLPPGVMIGVTVGSLILIGNALRDALNGDDVLPRVRRTAAIPASASAPATQSAPDALLEVSGLSVGYAGRDGNTTTVVKSVSFTIARGEILGLVGESGSGKTQTALSILRLLPEGGKVTGGSIWLEGQNLIDVPESQMQAIRGRRIGYIPQEPMSNLDPLFRIGDQLCEPLQVVGGLSRRQAEEKALALLERVGIADPRRAFRSYPHQISGGMAQRVLIAGALSCDPDLLIADEPTTALDVTVQAEILDLIRDLKAERNLGVLLVTHNFGVVADLCDRVAVMRAGEIVEQRPVLDIFAQPQHDYTRTLLGSTLEGAPLRPPLVPRPPRQTLALTQEVTS